jgi:glycosyltransferase involved in cell wall biosynthesis
LSVLESMACGTPVACSDMRSLREVADETVIYFPHDDAEMMGQSLAGLIDDVEYRRQLRYRGLARAKLFTWERSAELIMGILERVARKG